MAAIELHQEEACLDHCGVLNSSLEELHHGIWPV